YIIITNICVNVNNYVITHPPRNAHRSTDLRRKLLNLDRRTVGISYSGGLIVPAKPVLRVKETVSGIAPEAPDVGAVSVQTEIRSKIDAAHNAPTPTASTGLT
ncbi:hypothetical protein H7171_00135, partial [Candidatus Saccharibacteria bacterium]|nr:hypothetical protein [Candidatus Saccharibacteria bacterium]